MPGTAAASSSSCHNKVNPVLVAFKPRQVLLRSSTMEANEDKPSLKPEDKLLLLESIAHYFKRCGFIKALKKFSSEAKIEKGGFESSAIDIEEMYLKYLEMCGDAKKKFNNQEEHVADETSNGLSKAHGENGLNAGVEKESKKKKKKRSKLDCQAENIKDCDKAEEIKNDSGPTSNVQSKEKDKKKNSDSLGHDVPKEEVPRSEDATPSEGKMDIDTEKKAKDKKKKKHKVSSDSLVNGEKQCNIGDNNSSAPKGDIPLEEKSVKSKGKKKNKDGVSETMSSKELEEVQLGNLNGTISKHGELKESDKKEKKDSKKRKRIPSEENDSDYADKETEEPKKDNKVEGCEESKEIGDNGNQEYARKGGDVDKSELKNIPNEQVNGQANGIFEKSVEKSSSQRALKKQRNGSAEPKTVKAFQRVKADEVTYADERLQDNSYWAKDGAEFGYGAKAEEVLGQVRGRGFRHEKTKKKRGTYKGGLIDVQAHSIKFNYSDED